MNHTTTTHRVISVLLVTALLALWGLPGSANDTSAEHVLWYTQSAQKWSQEALPLGNGRLGCMIYGGTDKEQLQFNEDTLWTGDETDTGAYQAFGDIIIELGHDHSDDYRRILNLSAKS